MVITHFDALALIHNGDEGTSSRNVPFLTSLGNQATVKTIGNLNFSTRDLVADPTCVQVDWATVNT